MSQHHTHHIGSIELTTYDDGRFVLPSEYFTNVPANANQERQTEIGANLWMVKSDAKCILVDTGSAEALKAMFPETGQAWPALQKTRLTDVFLTICMQITLVVSPILRLSRTFPCMCRKPNGRFEPTLSCQTWFQRIPVQ